MVCRQFKIYIPSFSCTCSYETISHMNEVNAESPYDNFKALSIFITKLLDFKVWTNYTIVRDFCSKTGPTMCHENNFN